MRPPYALVVEVVVGVALVHAIGPSHSMVVSWDQRVGGYFRFLPS